MKRDPRLLGPVLLGFACACAAAFDEQPVHAGLDAVLNGGDEVEIEAKFAYGPASQDLEDATVRAQVRIAGAWHDLGEATTSGDGRARATIPAGLLVREGVYELRWTVAQDGTTATARAFVLAPGAKTVVFDIDGTLTTDDLEIVEGNGADMYEGADAVVEHYVRRGYQPVFVTGRPYLFDAITRRWLDRRKIPAGPLFMTQDVADAIPAKTAAYKRGVLDDLATRAHLDIEWAYGNATTDICAYAEFGITAEKTFIIGKHAGEACEGYAASQPVADYPSHLEALEARFNPKSR